MIFYNNSNNKSTARLSIKFYPINEINVNKTSV